MSPSDDAFQVSFANLYNAPGLQVPWYAVLGALCTSQIQRIMPCCGGEVLASTACTLGLKAFAWVYRHV